MILLHSGCKVYFALPDAMKGSLVETLKVSLTVNIIHQILRVGIFVEYFEFFRK